jgi:hypothetical protein
MRINIIKETICEINGTFKEKWETLIIDSIPDTQERVQ